MGWYVRLVVGEIAELIPRSFFTSVLVAFMKCDDDAMPHIIISPPRFKT